MPDKSIITRDYAPADMEAGRLDWIKAPPIWLDDPLSGPGGGPHTGFYLLTGTVQPGYEERAKQVLSV
jgi:hypothetical protein